MNQLFVNIIETTLIFTIIIVVLLFVLHLIGKKFTAKCRYILWALIFIRLAIPFGPFSGVALFTFELPITESSIMLNTLFSSSNNSDSNTGNNSISYVGDNSNPNAINTLDNSDKVNAQENLAAIVNPDVANGINLSNDSSSFTLTKPSQSIGFFEIYGAIIFSILTLIWVTVAIVYFFWHIIIYLLYTTKVKKCLIPADQSAHDILSQLCAQEKITRIPKIYFSTTIGSPMLYGFLHSTIVIPENLKGNHSLTGIITHELIHYKRRDLWLKLIAMFAESVHWFNPLIHVAARKFEAEMELSCDELVLKNYNAQTRASYGNAMLDIVKRCQSKNTVLTTHFNPKKSSIKGRFMNILDNTKKRTGKPMILVMILICVLAGTLIASNVDSSTNTTTNNETETSSTDVSVTTEIETVEDGSFIPTGTAGVLYLSKGNDNFIFSSSDNKLSTGKTYVGSYPCTTSNASFKCGYDSKILIYDNGYFIYDYITGKSKEVIIPNIDSGTYAFVYDTDSQKILGLRIGDNISNRMAFYSFKMQKLITDFTYWDMNLKSAYNYLFVHTLNEDSILNIDTGKVLFNAPTTTLNGLNFLSNKNGFYIISRESNNDRYDIFNRDLKLVLGGIPKLRNAISNDCPVMINDNGNVTVVDPDRTTFSNYNMIGKRVSKSQSYKQVLLVSHNCAGVIDTDNYIKIIDITTGAELVKFSGWGDKSSFYSIRLVENDAEGTPLGFYFTYIDFTIAADTKGYYKRSYYNPDTGENRVDLFDYNDFKEY